MTRKYFLLIILILIMQQAKSEQAIFGGGCFWCTEAVFQNLKGVIEVIPGYSGGEIRNPAYRDVCSGETGHAEVINITFNPELIQFEKLLEVFFITHDPTSLNQQGADIGTQYRSVVFYNNQHQKKIAEAVINSFNEKNIYDKPIVTEVSELKEFFPAENYHNDYFARNGHEPYCKFVIQPKMEKFRKVFEDMLKE